MAAQSFLKQLTGAALVVGTLITGLYYVGHSGRSEASAPGDPATSSAELPVADSSALTLVPERAWLVIEFDGQLGNPRPFGSEGAPCNAVAAPERVVFAVAPGPRDTDELSFFLGTPEASDAFFACATAKIVASGGQVQPSAAPFAFVASPSGLLARHGQRVLFSTSRESRPELERLLLGQGLSAKNSSRHGRALAALEKDAPAPLALSLELPSGWLTQMDPGFVRSPLVALTGATLSITGQGGARGVVRCEPSGCAALEAFAERALRDLLAEIPPSLQPRFEGAVRLTGPSPAHPGELQLEVTAVGVGLVRYLLGSWGETSPIP